MDSGVRRNDGVSSSWRTPGSIFELPAVRLRLQYPELFELRLEEIDALFRSSGQRRARRADRPAHHDHRALERRRVLLLEELPQARNLELAVARGLPVAVHQ